jgi:hypothetical protein
MQSGNAPTLQDGTAFWLGLGALLAVVGGIPVAVTPATLPQHRSPWSSGWFDVGVVFVLLGLGCALWALVLYIAHRHAADHWCPDRQAHDRGAPRPALLPVPAQAEDAIHAQPPASVPAIGRDFRVALHEVRQEVHASLTLFERMTSENRWWNLREGYPKQAKWKRYRGILELRAPGPLFRDLMDAYDAIAYVSQQGTQRLVFTTPGPRPSDRLPEAIAAIKKAEARLDAAIDGLPAVPLHRRTG